MKNKKFYDDEFDKEFPDRDVDKEKREFIERIKSVKASTKTLKLFLIK